MPNRSLNRIKYIAICAEHLAYTRYMGDASIESHRLLVLGDERLAGCKAGNYTKIAGRVSAGIYPESFQKIKKRRNCRPVVHYDQNGREVDQKSMLHYTH